MSHAPIRILVVEDSMEDAIHLRRLLRQSLSSTGFEFVHLTDGSELLSEIERTEPEVVLLDYKLPGKNGIELLKSVVQQSDVPVIMVTGQGGEREAADALRAGAVDYLVKDGLNAENLNAAIFRSLARARYEAARKALEMRTAYAEGHRHAVFHAFPRAALLLDRQGGVTDINEAGIAAFGWTKSEAVGRHFHDLAHRLQPDERHDDPFSCPVMRLLSDESEGAIEDEFICRSDGTFTKGHLRIEPISAKGAHLGHLVTFEPSTVRADQAELEAARSDAREIRDVLNVISHVVKTPMTPIMLQMGHLDRLLADDEDANLSLSVIRRNLERMQKVFDHALEVVHLRRGDIRVATTECDLADIVAAATKAVSTQAAERAVPIEVEAAPTLVLVDKPATTKAIETLLLTVLSRSLPSRPIQLHVTQDEQAAVLTIEDFGTTIDATQLSVLMDPFGFTVDERMAGEHVEHALRFYSAKLHLMATGARVDLRSDKSTVITIRLPLAKPGNAEKRAVNHPAAGGRTERPERPQRRHAGAPAGEHAEERVAMPQDNP